MLPWYVTREVAKRAGQVKSSARGNDQVDRLIGAASRDAEGDLHRVFYPKVATYTFPAPNGDVLFLEFELEVDLVQLDVLTVDGTTLVEGDDFVLLPEDGPPYTMVQFVDGPPSGSGPRPIQLVGTWGYDDVTEPAGQLAAQIADTTTTTVDVTDSHAAGVGDLLTVESEKMIVAGRAMLDTGQDLAADLAASVADRTLAVADGTAFAGGEELLVDAEKMLVTDISGNDLIVMRAWDGSVLAAHTTGADIFAPRRLSVQRGALGTTAATHADQTPVARQVYHELLQAYTVALFQYRLVQELAAQTGEPAGRGIVTVVEQARQSARKVLGRNR